MARRNRSSAEETPATTQPEEASVSTATEAPAENTAEATVPEPASEPANTEAKADKPKAEVDLTDFKAAVATALESKDESTGDLPVAAISTVNTAYRALEGLPGKNAARKYLNEAMREAMDAMDIVTARAYVNLSDGLSGGGGKGTGAPRPPADPTKAYVQQVAAVRLALDAVQMNVPENVAENWADQVKELINAAQPQLAAYAEYMANEDEDKTEPEGTLDVVKAAFNLASGRSSRVVKRAASTSTAYTGSRRDIGEHIRQAFEGQEVGTFLTVGQIRSFKSSEYGDDSPSSGAISARLFPKSGKVTIDGVAPATDESGKKGARKV